MNTGQNKIKFHYLTSAFYFPNRSDIKRFLLRQLKRYGKKTDAINYIFCDDHYLLRLNVQYLKHNTLTDIITFELSSSGDPLLADIYISIDRVRANAKQFGTAFNAELLRVIFHGTLHLVGFKDKKEKDAKLMRSKEEEFLRLFNISRETKTQK